MGINYYARVIPKQKQKENLIKMIHLDNFEGIKEQVALMYDSFNPYRMENKVSGEIHLGKGSGGWKFLWNPNIYQIKNGHYSLEEQKFIVEPDTPYYVYPLTKEGIKAFVDREDVVVYDEYGEDQNKDEFFKMALEWSNALKAWDADSYNKEHPTESRLTWKNKYTGFLESLGYKLSKDKSDFYSDGLRFATTTEFS